MAADAFSFHITVLWLKPSVEIVSRDRGTTYADGASRGAPHALQIADRWHLLHNLGEALEKVLARHHTDLKRAFVGEEEHPSVEPVEQASLTQPWVSPKRSNSGGRGESDAW